MAVVPRNLFSFVLCQQPKTFEKHCIISLDKRDGTLIQVPCPTHSHFYNFGQTEVILQMKGAQPAVRGKDCNCGEDFSLEINTFKATLLQSFPNFT